MLLNLLILLRIEWFSTAPYVGGEECLIYCWIDAEDEASNTGLTRLSVNNSTQRLSLNSVLHKGCGGLWVAVASSIRSEKKDKKCIDKKGWCLGGEW